MEDPKKKRIAVSAPGEETVIYPSGVREPQNKTAFREAERRFKKKTFDMKDVIDLSKPIEDPRVKQVKGIEGVDNLFTIIGSGFYFLQQELTPKEQVAWITSCVSRYTHPRNMSNLDAHYKLPESGLWSVLKSKKTLRIERIPCEDDSAATKKLPLVQEFDYDEQIEKLWRKYRWVSIGKQYNWKTRDYFERSEKVDEEIVNFCKDLCSKVGLCENFVTEAGIVNFYKPGDTLTGHVDRSEKTMDLPLVSISLGASCVFLLGGKTREDPVIPLILHSGDICIMSGQSRSFYHGVPRILEPSSHFQDLKKTEDEVLALNVLGNGRINLNVRHVGE